MPPMLEGCLEFAKNPDNAGMMLACWIIFSFMLLALNANKARR